MNQDYVTELQAKETLNLLSYCDQLRHWEDFNNLPKINSFPAKQKKLGYLLNERSIRQNSTLHKIESGKYLKTLLIPKKPIFQERTELIKNERRKKGEIQMKKKIAFKFYSNCATPQENRQNESSCKKIDLIKFCLQHRFEQNSMNSLIYRISQMRKGAHSIAN